MVAFRSRGMIVMKSEKDCAGVADQKQLRGIDGEGSIMCWEGKSSLSWYPACQHIFSITPQRDSQGEEAFDQRHARCLLWLVRRPAAIVGGRS